MQLTAVSWSLAGDNIDKGMPLCPLPNQSVWWSDQIFLLNFCFLQKMFPDSSYYKKYNGSCFMYICEILTKLQMFLTDDIF